MGLVITLAIIALLSAVAWYLVPIPTARLMLAIERRRSGLESHNLQAGDYRWHYLRGGTGQPLVVLHGIGADADNWTRVANHLTDRFDIIAPDLLGFGDSDCPEDISFAVEHQARYLRAFTRALGLSSFHLAGNSMGGFVAASYARQFPEQVKSLWLLAPGGIISSRLSETMQAVFDGHHNPLTIRHKADFERLIDLCFYRKPFMPYPVRALLRRRAMHLRTHTEKVFDDLRFRSDSLETISDGLAVPCLIVWGENDRVLDPSGGMILARQMPNSRLVLVDHMGHIPMVEQPEYCVSHFLRFIDDIAQKDRLGNASQADAAGTDQEE